MKTRSGFVSNSSSSSFVLVTTEKGHAEALSKLSSHHAAIVELLASKVPFGKDTLISVAYHNYQDCGCNTIRWTNSEKPEVDVNSGGWCDELGNELHDNTNDVSFFEIIDEYEAVIKQIGCPVLLSNAWS